MDNSIQILEPLPLGASHILILWQFVVTSKVYTWTNQKGILKYKLALMGFCVV